MTEPSDYKRLVEKPMLARKDAQIAALVAEIKKRPMDLRAFVWGMMVGLITVMVCFGLVSGLAGVR